MLHKPRECMQKLAFVLACYREQHLNDSATTSRACRTVQKGNAVIEAARAS